MNDENDISALDALTTFCMRVLRVVAPMVPAVKINSAYFEKYLWEGVEAFYTIVSEAEALGVEIIGDVKRGDIGHTAEAYAQGHIQNPELTGLEDVIAPDLQVLTASYRLLIWQLSRAKVFSSGCVQAIHQLRPFRTSPMRQA